MKRTDDVNDLLVSVVIPCHNEAEGIGETLNQLQHVLTRSEYEYELIVVDDGSPDGTYEKIQELQKNQSRLRGIQLSRNFGKEAALLAGLTAARGDAVITIDADLQHPPALIPQMLSYWRQGFTVVHGVKSDRSGDGVFVRWRAALFNSVFARLSGIDVRDSSDFKLLDRLAVDVIVQHLPERRRFYRGLADWVGFKQVSIPFTVAERNNGNGKWSPLALLDLATTALLSFTSAPLRIVNVLGLLTLLFGSVIAADALWSWSRGKAVSGFTTIIITVLLLGSFIMISLGIVGEYIAKIYEEIKGRPMYLIASECGFDDAADHSNYTRMDCARR